MVAYKSNLLNQVIIILSCLENAITFNEKLKFIIELTTPDNAS